MSDINNEFVENEVIDNQNIGIENFLQEQFIQDIQDSQNAEDIQAGPTAQMPEAQPVSNTPPTLSFDDAWIKIKEFFDSDDRKFEPKRTNNPDEPRRQKTPEAVLAEQRLLAKTLLLGNIDKQTYLTDFHERIKNPGDYPEPSNLEMAVYEVVRDTDRAVTEQKLKEKLKEEYPAILPETAVEAKFDEARLKVDNYERKYNEIQPPIDGIQLIKAGDKVILNIRKNINAADIANFNEWKRENRNLLILSGRDSINGLSISLKSGSILLSDEMAAELRKAVSGKLPYFEMKSGSMVIDPDAKNNPLKILLEDTSQLHVWGKKTFSLAYEKNGRVINPLLDIHGLTVTYGTSTASYDSEKKTLTPQVTEIGTGAAVRSIADMQYGEGAVAVRENGMAQNYVNLDPAVRDESIKKADARAEAFFSYAVKASYGLAFKELFEKEEIRNENDKVVGVERRYTESDWKQYTQTGGGKIASWVAENKEALDYYAEHSSYRTSSNLLDAMKKAFSESILFDNSLLLQDEVIRRAYGVDGKELEERKVKLEKYLAKNADNLYSLITKNSSPFKLGTLCRAAIDFEKQETLRQNAEIDKLNAAIETANEKARKENKEEAALIPYVTEREIVNFEQLAFIGSFNLLEDNLFTETARSRAPVFESEKAVVFMRKEDGTYSSTPNHHVENFKDALKASGIVQREVQKTITRDINTLEHALERMKAEGERERDQIEKDAEKHLRNDVDLELTLARRTAVELCSSPGKFFAVYPELDTPEYREKIAALDDVVNKSEFERFKNYYYGDIDGIKVLIEKAYNGDFKTDADNPRIVVPETFEVYVDNELHTDDIKDAESILARVKSEDEFKARFDMELGKRSAEIEKMIEDGTFWQEYENNTARLRDIMDEVYGREEFEKINPAETKIVSKFSNRENYLAAMNRDIEYKLKAVSKAAEKKDSLESYLRNLNRNIVEIENKTLKKLLADIEKIKYDNVGSNNRGEEIKAMEAERDELEKRLADMKESREFIDATIKNYNKVSEVQNIEFARQFYDAYAVSEKLYANAETKADRLGQVFINSGNLSIKDAGLAGRSLGQIVNNPLRYNELIKKHAANIVAGMADLYRGYSAVISKYENPGRFFKDGSSDSAEKYKNRLADIAKDGSNGFAVFKDNLARVELAEKNLQKAWQAAFDKAVKSAGGRIHSGDTFREICKDEEVVKTVNEMNCAYNVLCNSTIGFKNAVNNTLKDMYYDLKPETRQDFLDSVTPDGGMCILKDGNQENSIVNTCLPLKLIQGFDVFDAVAKDGDHTFCIGQGESMEYGALYGTKGINSVVQWLDEAYRKEYEAIKERNKDEKMSLRTLLDGIASFCSGGEKASTEGFAFEKFSELIDKKEPTLGHNITSSLKAIVKQKIYDLDQITAWEKLNPELEDYIALLSPEGVKLRNAWSKAKEEESEVNNNRDNSPTHELDKYNAHIATEKAKAAYEDFKLHRKSEFGRWVYNNSDVKLEASNSVPNGEEEVYVNEKLKDDLKLTTNEGTMRTVSDSEKEKKGYKDSQIFAARMELAADSLKKNLANYIRGYHRVTVSEGLLWIIIGSLAATKSLVKLPVSGLKYVTNNHIVQKNAAMRVALGAWVEDNFEKITDENLKAVGMKLKPEAVERLKREGVSIKDGGRTVRIDLEKSSGGRFTGIQEFSVRTILNLKNKEDAEGLMKKLAEQERKARGWLLEKNNKKLEKRNMVYKKIDEKEQKIDQAFAKDDNFRKRNFETNSGDVNPLIEKVGKDFEGISGYAAPTARPVSTTGTGATIGRGR